MNKHSKIIVTGGAGFIGSNLCEYLYSEYSIKVKDVIPDESKPFSKIYNKNKKNYY